MKRAKVEVLRFGTKNIQSILANLVRTIHAQMSRIIRHYLPEDVMPALQHRLDTEFALKFVMDNRTDFSDFKVNQISSFTHQRLTKVLQKHVASALSSSSGRFPRPLLSLALERERIDVAQLLLEAGATARSSVSSECQCHPLEFAQDIETIDLFLKYNYDINFKCIHGCTPFKMIWSSNAKTRNKNLVLSYLVRCGADPVTPNTQISHLSPFLKQLVLERVFVKVIVAAILQPGIFRDFLAEGVCDARILIHVATFT